MRAQDTRFQEMLKIQRTTLGFGVVQILLGISLTSLSFTAFAFTSSDRIRNACPYWAGFTVFCSGCVGLIAWRNSSVMSMSLFTFFSAVCVVLQMIASILTGDAGRLLKSLLMCEKQISAEICRCCDSIQACQHSSGGIDFEGVNDCTVLTGLLTGLMYGLFVLTIFGSLLCFLATILGCTAVARETSRSQRLCSSHSSRRSYTSDEDRYTCSSYPTDLTMIPSYAPPVYHSVENFQDYGLSSCIVPPPVFDPTDLPPPYSSQNHSLSESQNSLSFPEFSTSQNRVCQELNELHFQPVQPTLQSPPIHGPESNTQRNEATALRGTPSGVICLNGGDPLWDKEVRGGSQSTEFFPVSESSCLSTEFTNKPFSDQEEHPRDDKVMHCNRTVGNENRGVVALKPRHASNTTPRLHRELCEVVPANARSEVRASSLGTPRDESQGIQGSRHPGTPTLSSPFRRATILSLARCSRLGENSIYVNSFEVLARPPPNVQAPQDEPSEPLTTDCCFNTRNVERRLQKRDSHLGISLIEKHGGNEQTMKDGRKHRRRRHGNEVSRKLDAGRELPASQVNCCHGEFTSAGKETVV